MFVQTLNHSERSTVDTAVAKQNALFYHVRTFLQSNVAQQTIIDPPAGRFLPPEHYNNPFGGGRRATSNAHGGARSLKSPSRGSAAVTDQPPARTAFALHYHRKSRALSHEARAFFPPDHAPRYSALSRYRSGSCTAGQARARPGRTAAVVNLEHFVPGPRPVTGSDVPGDLKLRISGGGRHPGHLRLGPT